MQQKSQKVGARRVALNDMLAAEYGEVDRRALFWGAVTGALVAGFLVERIAPTHNVPRKLLRYSGLTPWSLFL